MSGGLVTAAYIVAAILFIFSLAGLSKHETSQQGNYFGIAGMAIALIATILGPDAGNVGWIIPVSYTHLWRPFPGRGYGSYRCRARSAEQSALAIAHANRDRGSFRPCRAA